MPEDPHTFYNTYIDYEGTGHVSIPMLPDHQAMHKIAAENFSMNKRELGEVIADRRFNVPEYQRLFSWREEQHQQLWADIQKVLDAELERGQETISDRFFSTMYFAKDERTKSLDIIDGQQRITTIHVLLRVIFEHLERIDDESINEDSIAGLVEGTRVKIDRLLYDIDSISGGKTPRLTLNKHDDDGADAGDELGFFEALILGPETQFKYLYYHDRRGIDGRYSISSQIKDVLDSLRIPEGIIEAEAPDRNFGAFIPVYDSHWRLINAYDFYHTRVDETLTRCDDAASKALVLVNLTNYLLNSYYVGEFIIRDASPDFRMHIFEILNDRGIELTKIDRIRAAVVNAFYDASERDDYIEKWEEIVAAFGTNEDRIDQYLAVYLSIVDEEIDSVGMGSTELTHAFGTQNLETDVEPRLDDIDTAKDFVAHANELMSYYKELTSSIEPADLSLGEYSEQCHEILVRLNNQGMDRWRPFVLALYYYTDTKDGDPAKFYAVLDTIEKLNFRRRLVGADSNIFQTNFIDAVHQFGLNPMSDAPEQDPYERAQRFFIQELRSTAATLFGDRFVDTITQAQDWNPGTAKYLFGKLAHQHFRSQGSIVDRRLDMSKIHLEHIVPQSLVHDLEEPVWLREFFKIDETDRDIATVVREYIELSRRDDDTLDADERQRRQNIEEFITRRFINDVGNFLLLRDSDNIRASNRPLSEKLPQYYADEAGFISIPANRYFTPADGPFDRDKLDILNDQYEEKYCDDHPRTEMDADLIAGFNDMFTYESMQDRRVDLIMNILEGLQLNQLEDEFGLASDPEEVRERIRTLTEREFNERLSRRSV